MSKLLTPSDLSPHQLHAYKDIYKKKVMCITSDCGFGKSVVGLSAFKIVKKKHKGSKMLVVCTPEGVKRTWSVEHKKWSHTKNFKVIPLIGTPKQRLKLLSHDADIYVISYNSLNWLVESNKHINFNFVFADEGDCLKSPSSKWRSYLLKAAPKAVWRIIASATPKTREEDDYWGLCKYLDDGKSLYADTVTDFRHKYCKSFVFNNRQVWKINTKMIPVLEDRIKHLFINYEMSDNATIPIVTKTCTVELSDKSMAKYKLLQTTQCVNSILYNDDGSKNDDESLDAMQITNKLAQLSTGFLYKDENLRISPEMLERTTNVKSLLEQTTKRVAVDVFDDRIVAFKKLLKKIHKVHGRDVSIAIPYNFKHELTQLKRILPNGVTDTEPNFQKRWNQGEIKYLFLQYSRSSKSLNLQNGGYIMAVYNPTFKWVDDYQIVRRIARQGQKAKKVYVYRLYVKGTIDDIKTRKLKQRFQGHSRFQNKIMKGVLGEK